LRGFLLLLLCLMAGSGHAQVFDRLYEGSKTPVLDQPLQWLAAPKASVLSPDVFEGPQSPEFQAYTGATVLPTSATQEVWARFALPATETPQSWFLRIPRQSIGKVSLYSRDAAGNWQVQSAGDAIAPSQWALRTRDPSFELQTRSAGTQPYYLRFEHRGPIAERPMLLSPVEYINGASRVGIVIGLMLGMFSLLAILCMAAFAMARNTVFLWFGAFVVTLMFTQLVLIGYGSWRLWPHSVHLNQVMGWVSTALTMAAGAWFCAKASYAKGSHPWIHRLLVAVAIASLLMACLGAIDRDLVARDLRILWVGAATTLIIASLVWMSLRGHRWNLLLLAGAAPIGVAALARLVYNAGWLQHPESAQAAGVLTAQLGLLWIFLALAWRSRAALLSKERGAALASYDPATGLMLPGIAQGRLPRMLLRANRQKSACGVLMLRWLNHGQTQGILNNERRRNAVLSLLGEILRRAARDVDTLVRYDEDHFMMLVEGPISRGALSEASTQILAACIRAAEKQGNSNAFNLHIAIWHDSPGALTAPQVIEILKTRLHQMSAGTRRPVQFVDAASEPVTYPGDGAVQRKDDLLAKIDAIESSSLLPARKRELIKKP
jgi:GGDEF domain-containing protein